MVTQLSDMEHCLNQKTKELEEFKRSQQKSIIHGEMENMKLALVAEIEKLRKYQEMNEE